MRFTLLMVLLLWFGCQAFGQDSEHCGQFELEKQWINRQGKGDVSSWRQQLAAIKMAARTTTDTDTIFIPVVVHVMHVPGHAVNQQSNISLEQIRSQIEVLNEDFNKILGTRGDNSNPVGGTGKIVFFLARLDPQGNPTNGVNRMAYASSNFFNFLSQDTELKSLSMWPPTRYLNIWIVNSMSGDVIGYAYLPETLASDPVFREQADGVVVVAKCFGSIEKQRVFDPPFNIHPTLKYGRTATHEVGHYLNLYHTWGDVSDCSGTDYVEDTAPCSGPLFGCPSIPVIQCNNETRMIENYLDYTDDGCMNVFTVKQIQRMRSAIRNYTFRSNMVSIQNLTSTGFFINNQVPKDMMLAASDSQSVNLGMKADSLIVRVRNNQLEGIVNWPVRFQLTSKPPFSKTSVDTVLLTQSGGIGRFNGFKPDVPGDYTFSISSQVPEGSPRSVFLQVRGNSKVFPNPYSDRIYIQLEKNVVLAQIRLLDMSGRELDRQTSSTSGDFTFYTSSRLSSGIYLLEVSTNKGIELHRVMKQ